MYLPPSRTSPLRVIEPPSAGSARGGRVRQESEKAHAGGRSADLDRDLSRTLAALGGVAARTRLHALHPARPGDEAAATGFAFTMLAQLAGLAAARQSGVRQRRPILWVQDRRARLEAGLPYAPGLERFGIDPSQIVIVATTNVLDALAATEIGLETSGLDGVLVEMPPNLPADMLALGKRLALRAEKSATPCMLLHASAAAVPAPVATRWQVASRPAFAERPWSRPLAAVDLTLVKNRFGVTGRWSAILDPAAFPTGVPHVRPSHVSAPLPESLDAVSADRPRQASA
jgi:hypothetical protein